MRPIFLLLCFAAGFLLPALPDTLSDLTAQEPVKEDGPLTGPMKAMKQGLRALRGPMADPEMTLDAVDLLRFMQGSALEAFPFPPPPFGDLSKTELRTWEVRFRRNILKLADQLCAIELALLEERREDALALYRDLGKVKKTGHSAFKAD